MSGSLPVSNRMRFPPDSMSAAYPQSFCIAEAWPKASYRTVICGFGGPELAVSGADVVAAQPASPADMAANAAAPPARSTSRRDIVVSFLLASMYCPPRVE
jgi:hypothetical protein